MYYVTPIGQDDEKFIVGRTEHNHNGKITFVRKPNTFKSRSAAEKFAAQLNGKPLTLKG